MEQFSKSFICRRLRWTNVAESRANIRDYPRKCPSVADKFPWKNRARSLNSCFSFVRSGFRPRQRRNLWLCLYREAAQRRGRERETCIIEKENAGGGKCIAHSTSPGYYFSASTVVTLRASAERFPCSHETRGGS